MERTPESEGGEGGDAERLGPAHDEPTRRIDCRMGRDDRKTNWCRKLATHTHDLHLSFFILESLAASSMLFRSVSPTTQQELIFSQIEVWIYGLNNFHCLSGLFLGFKLQIEQGRIVVSGWSLLACAIRHYVHRSAMLT
jgi:hypothetical protein